MNGQVLHTRQMNIGDETVELSSFPAGMYILYFTSPEIEGIYSKKIIKF